MEKKPLIFGSGVSSFKDRDGLLTVCEAAIEHGIMRFDTAPSYRTEEVLADSLNEILRHKGIQREQIEIQTKIDPIQMYDGHVEEYFEGKLKKMRLDYVDTLLIHWPVQKYFMKTWESMCNLKDKGLVRRLGICNLRISHLKELEGIGVIPEVLQIERHPLNTFMEERQYCVRHHIDLQDYSPLCKMHPLLKDNPLLLELSRKYNRNIGLIILRWHIDTLATPIFTSKKPSRIEEYSAINDFRLAEEDISLISSLNINHKLYLESLVCPGF